MVICRYFVAGCCRFGNSCRYEHSYNNQYNYRVPQIQAQTQVQPQTHKSKLADMVANDAREALQHHQYILSCYSPIRGNANLPGFTDISPEEMRYFFTNGVLLGREIEFKNMLGNCLLDAKQKFSSLVNQNSALQKILEDIENNRYNTNISVATRSENDFFDHMQNIFKSNNNTFTKPPVADKASMIFASAANSLSNNSPVNNIPNQMTANVFQESSMDEVTGANIDQSSSIDKAMLIFGQVRQNLNTLTQNPVTNFETNKNVNVFSQNIPNSGANINAFSQNVPNPLTNKNIFTQNVQPAPVNPFLSFGNIRESTETIYSKPESISKLQEKAFTDPVFSHGFIPEIAPTQELIA